LILLAKRKSATIEARRAVITEEFNMDILTQQTNRREVSEETQTLTNVQKIRESLSLLCDEKAGIVELRAWSRNNGIQSGFYNDLDKLAEDAAQLDASGDAECITVTMNPVTPKLLFQSANRLHQAGKGGTTADEHIISRHRLLIDCDPVRDSHTNSTSSEHALAFNKALAIREWLTECGWPAPAIASSGNGAHLIYRIELPNDNEAKKLIKSVLSILAAKFSDGSVKIDTSVCNASRVVRLYGTMNRKGENTQERPQKSSQVFWDETPSQLEIVTTPQLRELLPIVKEKTAKVKNKGTTSSGKQVTWAEQNPDLVQIFLTKGKKNDKGIYEMRGICHSGDGETALCYDPQTGAGWCNNKCDNATIRLAFDLSETYHHSENSEQGKTKKLIKKDELVRLAADAELFCEPDGSGDKFYVTVPVRTHFETYRINSNEFRLWLTNEFYMACGEAVSSQPMQDAINALAAKAYHQGNRHPVFIRIGELNGRLYYDLGDESWRVVEIDGDGWRVLDKSPVKFIRPAGYKAQVMPTRGGKLDELRDFINVSSDDDWTLFIGWLISCYRASGPYAILSLAGTQDAAKSTTTKMVRLLVDPSTALVRAQPKEERDLMVGAKNNWLLAFDNLSHISESLSDALCRVSTGGGQANRENYTNGNEYLFDVMRPVVMNGIEELATRPDLADRTINVFLPSLTDDKRKDEKVLYAKYEAALPRILGVIFDALSGAIKNLPHTKLDKLPRMADVARFVTAAEEALGWERGKFLVVYEEYRRTAKINALEASHVGTALLALMDGLSRWEGTSTDLLEELDKHLPRMSSRKNMPTSARGMSGALRRLIPNLKEVGIEVEMPEGARRIGGKVARKIMLTNSSWNGTPASEGMTHQSLPF
jgi:hypothetical protein